MVVAVLNYFGGDGPGWGGGGGGGVGEYYVETKIIWHYIFLWDYILGLGLSPQSGLILKVFGLKLDGCLAV